MTLSDLRALSHDIYFRSWKPLFQFVCNDLVQFWQKYFQVLWKIIELTVRVVRISASQDVIDDDVLKLSLSIEFRYSSCTITTDVPNDSEYPIVYSQIMKCSTKPIKQTKKSNYYEKSEPRLYLVMYKVQGTVRPIKLKCICSSTLINMIL